MGGRGKSVDGWLHPRWQRLFLKMLGLNLSVPGLRPLVTAVDIGVVGRIRYCWGELFGGMGKYMGGRGVSVDGMGFDQWVGSGGVGCESVGVWMNPCGTGVESAGGRGDSQVVELNP